MRVSRPTSCLGPLTWTSKFDSLRDQGDPAACRGDVTTFLGYLVQGPKPRAPHLGGGKWKLPSWSWVNTSVTLSFTFQLASGRGRRFCLFLSLLDSLRGRERHPGSGRWRSEFRAVCGAPAGPRCPRWWCEGPGGTNQNCSTVNGFGTFRLNYWGSPGLAA